MSRAKTLFLVGLACAFAGCKPSTSDPVGDKPVKESAAFKRGESDAKSRLSARINWNRRIRSGAYDKIGKRDPKWDAPARVALDLLAQSVADPASFNREIPGLIREAAAAAVNAGCDDALVVYVHLRYVRSSQEISQKQLADEFLANSEAMEQSSYGEMVKFFSKMRTANAIRAAYSWTNTPTDWNNSLWLASTHLTAVVTDAKTPIEDVYAATSEFLTVMETLPNGYEMAYRNLEGPLFKNWPKAAEAYLLKGQFYTRHAWHGRGGGYADGVSKEGWKLFFDRSKEAETAFETAWAFNPALVAIPEQMIRVLVALERPRNEMERWFARAMELNPNNETACRNKLWYLNPKWYGSEDEMLKFGRECMASEKWGGRVTLTVVFAHEDLASLLPDETARKMYWQRPAVWQDVKAAYERYGEKNPDENSWRANYAWFAYYAGRWEIFNQQIELLNPVDYAYFGGREVFEKMVETGKQKAGKK